MFHIIQRTSTTIDLNIDSVHSIYQFDLFRFATACCTRINCNSKLEYIFGNSCANVGEPCPIKPAFRVWYSSVSFRFATKLAYTSSAYIPHIPASNTTNPNCVVCGFPFKKARRLRASIETESFSVEFLLQIPTHLSMMSRCTIHVENVQLIIKSSSSLPIRRYFDSIFMGTSPTCHHTHSQAANHCAQIVRRRIGHSVVILWWCRRDVVYRLHTTIRSHSQSAYKNIRKSAHWLRQQRLLVMVVETWK